MRFGALYMIAWLWLIPAVWLFFVWAGKARKKALERFGGGGTKEITRSFNPARRKFRDLLVIAAVFFMVVALIRPQWGFKWQEVKRQGLDILIALDTSNSMLAEDVKPNRLARAKLAIKDFVKKVKGDRIGLIAFSGTAFLQCPLTADYGGFLLTLQDVDADTIPVGGTSISRAITTALASYEGGAKQYKVLIIITDGEDLEGGIDEAIQKAKAENVMISCVGIGTPEGELIPLKGEAGKKGFLKDKAGNVVKTRLDEEMMKKIALDTGGVYVKATGVDFGLDLIYDQKLSKLEKQDFESKMEKQYNEYFQWPLAMALLLLLVEPLIGERKKEDEDMRKRS
jgi:Ca-activated chloride channel family protein